MTYCESHHFVPASYFKPWCAANGKLLYFVWRENRLDSDYANPKFIAKEHNLYSLHGAPSEMKNAVEIDFFTKIDNIGAVTHKKLVSNNTISLTHVERHQWATYLMALRARTPEAIANARKLGSVGVREALRQNPDEYKAIKPAGAPDTVEECIEPWFLENFGISQVIPKVIYNKDISKAIVSMYWYCQDFSDCSLDLLTCDRPLIWHKGVQDKDFFLALPLSPKTVFFVVKNKKTWEKLCNLSLLEFAKKINESIVSNTFKYVYANNDSAKSFIEELRLDRS